MDGRDEWQSDHRERVVEPGKADSLGQLTTTAASTVTPTSSSVAPTPEQGHLLLLDRTCFCLHRPPPGTTVAPHNKTSLPVG